jgi:hypothetical protein
MSGITVTSFAVGELIKVTDSIDALRLKLVKWEVKKPPPTYEMFSHIAYIRYQAVKGVWGQQMKKYRSQYVQWMRTLVNSVGVLPPPGLGNMIATYVGGPQITLDD